MPKIAYKKHIHLLYVPTLSCNLACRYCYLGEQTARDSLKQDSRRAVPTLRTALESLSREGILAFNVSLHGGEPTMLPSSVMEDLFSIISRHYLDHFDELNARGFRKTVPHIKTNLFNFKRKFDLLSRHKVSISASIDLPLALHERYRTTKHGKSWLKRSIENLRLLAAYPHAKKISSTIYREHLENIPALISDIWRLHHEIGLDMNNFNFMFGFNTTGCSSETMETSSVPDDEQMLFYEAMKREFTGTALEEGLLKNWFDEFKPSYCTNSFNCGERFFLLQSDGEVWSCVRGQGISACRYGNILHDPVEQIMAAARIRIAELHQKNGLDLECMECEYLHICHTGCPVVKMHGQRGKSYTCSLQKAIYRDNPASYPPTVGPEEQQANFLEYCLEMHPAIAHDRVRSLSPLPGPEIIIPPDFSKEKNSLAKLIENDPLLRELYSSSAVRIEINGEEHTLRSQIFKTGRELFTITPEDSITLHISRSLFEVNCPETVRNTLHLQMLRDTPVTYGDEQRTKQEHLFTHQIFFRHLVPNSAGEDSFSCEISAMLRLHSNLFIKGILNNLFVTTSYLREYHYQKQKANAFYHIQAINLPFQNFEFYWES